MIGGIDFMRRRESIASIMLLFLKLDTTVRVLILGKWVVRLVV